MKEMGFSMVELILAMAVFIIFAGGAVAAVLSGLDSNRLGTEQTVASQFAAEGMDAVRSIRNQDYANLGDTSGTGLVRNGSVWAFSGVNNTFDKYQRVIKVEPVYRDASGDVKLSGTLDSDTKKITSTVTWNYNSARPESINLVSYLSNWRKPIISGGPIMMAYSKTTTIPYYRIWDGVNWGAEAAAQTVGGNINYIVLKSSRTRNEAILGTLDSNGNIYAQVWNGSSWGTPTLMANIGSTQAGYRSFDVDYEKSGDRAVFTYHLNTSPADFAYRIWDGNSWSSQTVIYDFPTSGVVRWIELAQNPLSSSNEIAMIMLDQNMDVYGMVWTGTNWSNMGVTTAWDTSASIDTKKVVDVAYEQNSGRAMFMWGSATATNQYFRMWNGSALSSPPSQLSIPAAGGTVQWVKLASRPGSNEIMYGEVDSAANLNTRVWSGSAWDTATQHPEHSGAVENITSMVFDIVWETYQANLGEAWLLWGDGTRVSKKQWANSAWGSASTLTGSDDTSFIRLTADPVSGAVFTGIYEDASAGTSNRDIWESHLTGGSASWTAKNLIWGGPTAATPVYFRIDIATP